MSLSAHWQGHPPPQASAAAVTAAGAALPAVDKASEAGDGEGATARAHAAAPPRALTSAESTAEAAAAASAAAAERRRPHSTAAVAAAEDVSYKGDVWSLGVALLELATLSHPFKGGTPCDVADAAVAASLQQRLRGVYTPELRSFLFACLRVCPRKRKSAKELLVHPWLLEHIATPKQFIRWLDALYKAADEILARGLLREQQRRADLGTPSQAPSKPAVSAAAAAAAAETAAAAAAAEAAAAAAVAAAAAARRVPAQNFQPVAAGGPPKARSSASDPSSSVRRTICCSNYSATEELAQALGKPTPRGKGLLSLSTRSKRRPSVGDKPLNKAPPKGRCKHLPETVLQTETALSRVCLEAFVQRPLGNTHIASPPPLDRHKHGPLTEGL
ncbi:glycine, alanine and asparagine-rich protein [Cyclospora cayetanensis]|uniref:non-specific serine/threonine protein kinase n=1 Tax=Cyclospora cayetanensis TaxID=88456 RepID=A0A6P6RW89_9EIME|nr:glycine, alanine and asparagine-rich protein [Cyclospora cayetanensis]